MRYQLFPRSQGMTAELHDIVKCFESAKKMINSAEKNLVSNDVLGHLVEPLAALGFVVERGKKSNEKISVPVLFGQNNNIDKKFYADALSADGRIVIEIEAGRAVVNNQFLKDIFQACLMFGVEYLALAVREEYRNQRDFDKIYTFLETLYISGRIHLPLKGILLIGY
jgi:hypothetical protein